MKKGLNYKMAGVDIEAGNEAVKLITPEVESTYRPEVISPLGGFAGMFALNNTMYEAPVLVSATDGVGTKLKIAIDMDLHHTVGIDLVAMCVNDILVVGAEPLFFLDYLAVGKIEPQKIKQIVSGVVEGCKQAGCALLGGETAEMPGFYQNKDYDMAGFTVGVVDREKIIDGKAIRSGDVVLGFPSSGLHSNGFSLARKILDKYNIPYTRHSDELGRTWGEALLTPTKIYVKEILALLEKYPIKGMAHITGGGIFENLNRCLPKDVDVLLDTDAWKVPTVFHSLQSLGQVETKEMYKAFNMGIGYCLIVDPHQADTLMKNEDLTLYRIGEIIEGKGEVVCRHCLK